MATHIIEGAEDTGLVAQHDDALAELLIQEVVAGVRDTLGTRDPQPTLAEELLDLLGEDCRRGVVLAREGLRARHVGAGSADEGRGAHGRFYGSVAGVVQRRTAGGAGSSTPRAASPRASLGM